MKKDSNGNVTFQNAELFPVAIGLIQYSRMDKAHAPSAIPTAEEAAELSKQAAKTYQEAERDEQVFGHYSLSTDAVRAINPELRRELTLGPDIVAAVALGIREVHKGTLSISGIAKELVKNPRVGLVRVGDRKNSKKILRNIT